MSYKQIDKEFEDRFSFLKTVVEKMGNKNIYWYDELKSFLHLIYDQAKAEQREIDARIAEGMNVGEEAGFVLSLPKFVKRDNEMFNGGYNRAVADIAKAIRED